MGAFSAGFFGISVNSNVVVGCGLMREGWELLVRRSGFRVSLCAAEFVGNRISEFSERDGASIFLAHCGFVEI